MERESFVDRYLRSSTDLRSILCIGLDPTLDHVPKSFGNGFTAMEQYLQEVINAAVGRVAVIKPQYAYFAALGTSYVEMMVRLIDYAKSKGLIVILDGKRADIGSTMEAYGNEIFGNYGVDACTFVPYLGSTFLPDDSNQSWMPWLEKGKMVITMIRTSNPGAAWLQDQKLESGLYVYEFVAKGANDWNQEVSDKTDKVGRVGGVVGATCPKQAISCRQYAGDDVFFLVPGYGAQGGGAEGAIEGLINSRGELIGTVNSSRGITLDGWYDRKERKPKVGDPILLVGAAIDAANDDLNGALLRKLGRDPYRKAA